MIIVLVKIFVLVLVKIFVLVLVKIFVLDLVKMFIIVVRKVVEWKQSLTQGVNVYKPGQHLPDAEADQVIQIFRW